MWLLDLFFPKRCLGCGREGRYICEKCEIFLSEAPQTIKNLFSVWQYEGVIEKAILKIKYDGCYDIINELTARALEKIELNLPADTYITYVPMYRKREKERGFNQAELIAGKIAELTKTQVASVLIKTKDNRSQVGLNPQERIENVKGVFTLWKPGFQNKKSGSVLLVDDVYTTGATMAECSKVLRKNGIKNIWGFTLSRKMNIQNY